MINEKIKEAIECLKAVHEAYDVICGDWSFCWTATEALEKQIPKKPLTEQSAGGLSVLGNWCPNCKWGVHQGEYKCHEYNYCPTCGQAIDWSEENGRED